MTNMTHKPLADADQVKKLADRRMEFGELSTALKLLLTRTPTTAATEAGRSSWTGDDSQSPEAAWPCHSERWPTWTG